METDPTKISSNPGIMIIRERIMPTKMILNLLAIVSHRTWLRQRWEHKGIPIEKGPQEVSEGDETRAEVAWRVLKEGKPKTRKDAVALVADSSHQVWLDGQKDKEGLDKNPNSHDIERAEDLINELERVGVLVFRNINGPKEYEMVIPEGGDIDSQSKLFIEAIRKYPFYNPNLLYSGFNADHIGEPIKPQSMGADIFACSEKNILTSSAENLSQSTINPMVYALSNPNPSIAIYDSSKLEKVYAEGYRIKDPSALVSIIRIKRK